MSDSLLITALTASLLRSVIVCSIACLLLPLFTGWIQRGRSRTSRLIRELFCVLPFFTPDLLTGFHYRLTASAWAGISGGLSYVLLTELLYGTLQLFRAVALGMLLRHIIPTPADTSEALYSWQLLRSRIPRVRWYRGWFRLQLAGPWRTALITWSLTAVVVFQEFETAALMQIDQHPWSWSVCLFDAHAAWQPLTESLRLAAQALLAELLLLLPGLIAAGCSLSIREPQPDTRQASTTTVLPAATAAFLVSLSMALLIFIPLLTSTQPALRGIRFMLSDPATIQRTCTSLATSVACSVAAAVCALGIASRIHSDYPWRSGWHACVTAILLLPGLAGPLILSLGLQSLFQLPLLRLVWDTWLPQLLGQTLWLLPRAFAAAQLLWTAERGESLHAASLLLHAPDSRRRWRAGLLLWKLQDLPLLMALLLLTQWTFWDVTTASLLHPLTFEPIVTRLYNEMHFARTEALLGLSAVALTAPATSLAVGAAALLLIRLRQTRRNQRA